LQFQQIVSYEDDWHFLIDSCLAAYKVVLCSDVYYVWNINDNSESHTHHYRTSYLAKRHALLSVIDGFLNEMDFIDPNTKSGFKTLLQKRSLLWGHWNALQKELKTYKPEIRDLISAFPPQLRWLFHAESYDEPITILLLWLRFTSLAYFFNKHIIKRYYQ